MGYGIVLGALALAAPAMGASREPGEESASRPRITVRVWDQGDFDAGVLGAAEMVVDHIFAKAHVTVSWRHCTPSGVEHDSECLEPQGPDEASVRVIDRRTAENARESLLAGRAVRSSVWEGSGLVYVYRDRIEAVSQKADIPVSVILGTVITHEIGHLLLPRGHSALGIMRGEVDLRGWTLAQQGNLLFTAEQSRAFRRNH